MSDIKSSFKKPNRQSSWNRQSHTGLEIGKNIGPYEIIDFIKEGSSSKIYKAKSKYTNEYVAVKAFNKSRFKKNLDELLLITKQIETLKILKHRNIITLYEIYESPKFIMLITEYLPEKDLIEKLIQKKRFSEEEALRIFFQLLDAFTYMHKMNICHRNLRTEHILFDKNNRPKIVGFGFSTFYESNKTIEGSFGSLCYACPEIINETRYNPELADVWSLGVILYVLVCGYLPFSDEDDIKNKSLISKGLVEFPKEISNKLKDLLKHMLEPNPNRRYNFLKVARHPWIKPYGIKIFSQGINIHKTIFPVDERILNIIQEYGFEKDKVINDLIMNKYNIGTGLYKQIVRKLLDLRIKNISDLCSEEFMEYRDNENNKYEEGEQDYEKFIEEVDERYRNKEDFINDFKNREEQVVQRLLYLKKRKDDKTKLNIIEEAIIDNAEEENDPLKNKSDIKNDSSYEDKKPDNIKKAITQFPNQRKRILPRTKTPQFNFEELIRGGKEIPEIKSIKSNNSGFDDNVQIEDNKEEDVDIIKKFQDEQNKKLSENIINKIPSRKMPSTPYFGKAEDQNTTSSKETSPFKMSITPDKKGKETNNLLDKTSPNIDIIKDSLYSKIYSGNVNDENNYKSILSGKTIASLNSNSNNFSKSLFRMTTFKKPNNNKSYLSRGSLFDDFLKKNHPDNIRKTILRGKKKISKKYSTFKENVEKENEKKEEKEEKENEEEEPQKNHQLRYSLSFGDEDEDEEQEEEEGDKEEDQKLFELLENEDDPELKNLRKYYFGEKELKKSLKKLKSIIKKKTVKFQDDEKNNEKLPDSTIKKTLFSKKSCDGKSDLGETTIKELNKNLKVENDSSILKMGSQLDLNFHDEIYNLYTEYEKYHNDIDPIKNLDIINNNDFPFNIGDIHNNANKKFLLNITKDIQEIEHGGFVGELGVNG